MQVKLDDEVLFEIDERMIALFAHDIEDPISDIKRRLRWVIEHKCDQCFSRMEKEYMEVIRNDPSIESLPKDKRALVDMIVKHPNYKNRAQREKESKEKENGKPV